jgi:hypothetical protein
MAAIVSALTKMVSEPTRLAAGRPVVATLIPECGHCLRSTADHVSHRVIVSTDATATKPALARRDSSLHERAHLQAVHRHLKENRLLKPHPDDGLVLGGRDVKVHTPAQPQLRIVKPLESGY